MATALALTLSLAPLPAGASRKPTFKKAEFKLEYRGVLGRLATGDAESSLLELVELESRTSAETGSKLEPLWKAKLSVVRDLLKAGPELLVPVSQLHEEAYLAYVKRGSPTLAQHSRAMTVELAEIYAERVVGTRGAKMASAVMTSLAGYLHAAFMDPNAAALYQRAVEIDPRNAAALLGLAGIYERHGDYDRALPVLRRLVEVVPEDREGRLRLAVHLVRVGQVEDAETLLRGLVEEPSLSPRWVDSLAFQELARILVDRDEIEEAVVVAESAIRALPSDPTLPILLAYVTDRAGRPSSKAALSAALREPDRAVVASPRYRYSQMPRTALAELRALLHAESAAQLATLAQALADGPVLAAVGSR